MNANSVQKLRYKQLLKVHV